MENLQYLYQLRRGLEPAAPRRFQVRVYDASPSIQLYRWDDKAFISFFPVGVRAYDARQIEAFMASPLGEFVEGRFDELWTSSTTRPMDEAAGTARPSCSGWPPGRDWRVAVTLGRSAA